MKITLYTDVLSMWCLLAERSLARLREAFGHRIEFEWKLALIRDGEPLGYTRSDTEFYYDRCEAMSGVRFNPSWIGSVDTCTAQANYAVEAARSLGCMDGAARLAVAEAAIVHGKPVWQPDVAADVVSSATGLDAGRLRERMMSQEVQGRVHETNGELAALGVDQRPVLVFENVIPDRAVLSGVYAYEPLAALAEAMLRDEERYLAFNAANPH